MSKALFSRRDFSRTIGQSLALAVAAPPLEASCDAKQETRPGRQGSSVDEGEAAGAGNDDAGAGHPKKREHHAGHQTFQPEWIAAIPPVRLRYSTWAKPAPAIIAANRA